MRLWYVWIVTGVLLMLVEIATPGFFAASVGVGALAAALVSYLGGGLTLQIAVFSISTLAVFVLARPLLRRVSIRYSDRRATNVAALIGQTCLVIEAIDNDQNAGRVRIGGELWKALSEDGGRIGDGSKAIVIRVAGATAYVRLI